MGRAGGPDYLEVVSNDGSKHIFPFQLLFVFSSVLINNKINIDKTAAVVTRYFLRAASDVFFVCLFVFFLNEILNLQKLKT